MIGGSTPEKLELEREQVEWILAQEGLMEILLLIVVDKADLVNSIDADAAKISEKLQLGSIKGRRWFIQKTSAKTREGLRQGIEWLRAVSSATKKRE